MEGGGGSVNGSALECVHVISVCIYTCYIYIYVCVCMCVRT